MTTVAGRILARLLLSITVVALFLGLAEVGIRVWPPVPDDQLMPFPYRADRVERIARGDTYIQFDHHLGWSLARGATRRDGALVFQTNQARMRATREYALAPPADRLRVATFGDSFTHCNEVSQQDCWSTHLEHSWRGTEVLNFGVPGYGPDQAWLRYQRDGRPFRPCTVLIGFFIEDIDRVVSRFRPFMHPEDSVMLSKPRFLLEGDGLRLLPNPTTDPRQMGDPAHVERTLGQHDFWHVPGTFVPGPLDNLALVRLTRTALFHKARAALARTPRTYPLYDQQGEAFQVTGRILIQFAEQVRADGASPAIVVFPGRRDLRSHQAQAKPHQPLVDWLVQQGIPTLDLTDVFAREAAQHGIDPLFAAGTHYSPLGNRLVAEELAKEMPHLVRETCVRETSEPS